MKTDTEHIKPTDFLGIARNVVLAKRELAQALEARAASETRIKALIASGIAEGNAAIKKERRASARAVHNRKVALHQARHEFGDRLEILRKRFGRKHLGLEALIKHTERIGFIYHEGMSHERREKLQGLINAEEGYSNWNRVTEVEDLQVFYQPKTGIRITLHDFTISEESGLFEIRLGNNPYLEYSGIKVTDFRIGRHVAWNDDYTSPSFGVLNQFFTNGVAEPDVGNLLRFYGQARTPGTYLPTGEKLLPTPEHFIKTLEIVALYVKVCGDLGNVLPICPKFETAGKKGWRGGRKIWLGELEPGLRHLPAYNPRDDLAVAVGAGLGLQLVRLKKADNGQANMVIPEFANPKDYDAIEYSKLATFYRAAK